MMPPESNQTGSFGENPREVRLGELINEFFDRRASGENLTEEQFLTENPEHAVELREHLVGLELLDRLGSSSRHSTLPGSPPAHILGSSDQGAAGQPSDFLPQVTGYQVLKQIGRGGMGVVFKAIQVSTKRAVALKVLLEGPLASEGSRRRFEREIALAAQLRHPNIIPIYDSGVCEGRMYYAMEYVHGRPLSDYLRVSGIDLPAKLRLFIKICNAVRHAHQRGVVHRDLKPSNILVDGECEPHILDFGLAKAAVLGDMTTSVTAQIIGTPAYMSPEQAAGDPSAIDTRTDVYSLGVVLYEMLTGRMPYDATAAIGKVLHNIAHAEPVPPAKVNPEIDGDLSAIVLKALEKEKEHRYQSGDALCGDVERYLEGEPISARHASGFYLLRKVARRYRTAACVGGVVVVLVVAALTAVRHYSSKAKESEARFRQLEQRSAQVEQPQPRIEPGSSLTSPEIARRDLEVLLKNMDPDVRRFLEPLARRFSERGVSPGQAVSMAAISLWGSGVVGADGRPSKPLPEASDYLPDPRGPSSAPSERGAAGGESIPAEVVKAAETIARYLYLQGADLRVQPGQAAATQPSPPSTFPTATVSEVGRAPTAAQSTYPTSAQSAFPTPAILR